MNDTDRKAQRPAPPRVGEVWRKNGSEREVEIEEVDSRWTSVRNIVTGRLSRIEIYTFNRRGKAGWTRVVERPIHRSYQDGETE